MMVIIEIGDKDFQVKKELAIDDNLYQKTDIVISN